MWLIDYQKWLMGQTTLCLEMFSCVDTFPVFWKSNTKSANICYVNLMELYSNVFDFDLFRGNSFPVMKYNYNREIRKDRNSI